LDAERPEVCVVDSVQTLHAADLTGAAGSVGQVREVADRITRLAKARGIAVLLVGHVTKEGALAGPRVLEHLVDCVLQFEGERERTYRTLRALKNRFGSTNDVGVFEMREGGLVEVLDASARFVSQATRAPGSVVLAAMEGSRPLLVEVQALVACFGEIGLTGELRSVAHPERRLEEAAKFGLRTVVSPESAPTLRAAVRGILGAARKASDPAARAA